MGDALGEASSVNEHEGGGVFVDEFGDSIEHFAHLFGRRNRLHLRGRDHQPQVQLTDMARVDDCARPSSVVISSHPNQQIGNRGDRLLGRGEPDPNRRLARSLHTQVIEPFHRQGQVRAAFVASQRMNLVDDDRVNRRQRGARFARRAHQIERLGSRDDERRRLLDHCGPSRSWRIAGAHTDPDLGRREPHRFRDGRDLGQRSFEVFGDIDRQSF